MRRSPFAQTALFSLALLLVAGSLSAGKKDKELSLRIEGDDGTNISFSISSDFFDGIVEGLAGSDIECDTTTDDDTLAMLRHLERRGEGSKYRFRDDDGQLIKASRRDGQLRLHTSRSGEKDAHVSMPWALAECMLGHRVEISDAIGEFFVEDEGSVRVKIE